MQEEFELKNINYLTQEWAQKRSNCITNVDYQIKLNFNKGNQYSGKVIINFDFSNLESKFLLLDYAGKQIQSIEINGQTLSQIQRNNVQVGLPISHLKENAKNTVTVDFNSEYNNDGSGLHSYIDPNDNQQYLYSQSFLFFANRIFPCFDQPDLKAQFLLTVQLNSDIQDWVVIANSILDNQENNTFIFKKSEKLPTYLFGVIAGPFVEIKCENNQNTVPMSLYSTNFFNNYLIKQQESIFETTQQCMLFYEEFFGYKYPFQKYDQIFCPEFNWGAMENAGMVIYTDQYVFKEQVAAARILKFSNTLAHELSHHWFGDLVTMKWWKDLWLNESFADFISHYCQYKIKNKVKSIDFDDIWIQFNTRKNWAYTTDQKSTTHSISGIVDNTQQADGILDGITYSKGASVLKQLMNFMGEDNFSKALKQYFNKYAFKNASLEDLIQTLQDNMNQQFDISNQNQQNNSFNLQEWKQQWLEKPGPNLLNVQEINDSQIIIKQIAYLQQFPCLRNHVIKIAYYSEDPKNFHIQENVLIKNEDQTIINIQNLNLQFKIQGVLINYQDEGYMKVHFDQQSLKYFSQNLSQIEDKLTRILIWSTLLGMVQDGIIKTEIFVETFIQQIKFEKSNSIYSQQLLNVQDLINNYTPQNKQIDLKNKMFEFLFQEIQNYVRNNKIEEQNFIQIKSQIFNFLNINNDKISLNNWCITINWTLEKNQELKKVQVQGTMLWEICCKIKLLLKLQISQEFDVINLDNIQQIIQKSLENPNNTVTNQRLIDLIRAQEADKEYKQLIFQEFQDQNNKQSPDNQSYVMRGFNQNKIDFEIYEEKWYQNLPQIFQDRTPKFAKLFFIYLFPQNQDLNLSVQKLQTLLENIKNLENVQHLKKQTIEQIDFLNQKIQAFKLYE